MTGPNDDTLTLLYNGAPVVLEPITYKWSLERRGLFQWYWKATASVGSVMESGPFWTRHGAFNDMAATQGWVR